MRDCYSGFGFFEALPAQDCASGTAYAGNTIDRRGYDAVTFVVALGQTTGAGSWSNGNTFILLMEHANDSAAGTIDAWSEVYPSQILNSVYGEGGAFSTLALAPSGLFGTVDSASWSGLIEAAGYVGDRRYVRIRISSLSLPSTMSIAAVAICGCPANWPVHEPVRLN